MLVAVFSCCLLSACGGTPPVNNRIGYDGTYKFAELKIYRATEYAGSYLPYEGDEDAAFSELVPYFNKEYVLQEANKQYFELKADGTAVWHLPTYLNYEFAPAETINGTWDIDIDGGIPYKTETYTHGSTNYGGDYTDFTNKQIEKTLFLYSEHDNDVKFQFSGLREVNEGGEHGYSYTENYWEIRAVYKLVSQE